MLLGKLGFNLAERAALLKIKCGGWDFQLGGILFFDFFFFLVTSFFFGGGGWVEAIPVTVVTLGPLDPLAI